jgi:uncharacterized YigZ family protein
MKTVKVVIHKTLEIKQSKFIAYLCPIKEYANLLQHLKNEHPKARHFVTASRYLNEYDQIVESSSDDGEPKGTSGKPSLKVIQGNELINSAVIIIRYFGGTKLGTGGLVRAYSDAVNDVIEISEFETYVKLESLLIQIPYSDLSKVEYWDEKCNIDGSDREFIAEGVKLNLQGTKENLEKLKLAFTKNDVTYTYL